MLEKNIQKELYDIQNCVKWKQSFEDKEERCRVKIEKKARNKSDSIVIWSKYKKKSSSNKQWQNRNYHILHFEPKIKQEKKHRNP